MEGVAAPIGLAALPLFMLPLGSLFAFGRDPSFLVNLPFDHFSSAVQEEE